MSRLRPWIRVLWPLRRSIIQLRDSERDNTFRREFYSRLMDKGFFDMTDRKSFVDPFQALNESKMAAAHQQTVHTINISVSKREFFAINILSHLVSESDDVDRNIKYSIETADKLISKLNEKEK